MNKYIITVHETNVVKYEIEAKSLEQAEKIAYDWEFSTTDCEIEDQRECIENFIVEVVKKDG